MVNTIKHLHFGMEGILSDTFSVSNELKQGCVLAPFLFNLYFNKVMQDVLKDFNDDVEVSYKMDGKLYLGQGFQCHSQYVVSDFLMQAAMMMFTRGFYQSLFCCSSSLRSVCEHIKQK